MIVLVHRDNPLPVMEVLEVDQAKGKMRVRPLWQQGLGPWWIDRRAYRDYGYYPKEVPDAIVPELG